MKFVSYFIKNCYRELSSHPKIYITDKSLPPKEKKKLVLYGEEVPATISNLYQECNGITLKWCFGQEEDTEILGSINILPLEHLFDETVLLLEGMDVVINDDPEFSKTINLSGVFRKVDLFTDEASVGFFSDPQLADQLYYNSSNRFYRIPVDFQGYFKLMCAAKGFIQWQRAILFEEYNFGEVEANWFREQMPLIFSDFNWDEFIELYKGLRNEKK